MVLCIDPNGLLYGILSALTTNATGSYFLSTLVISLVLMAIAALLRIPVEISMVLLLPLHLGLLACLGSDWLSITGTVLIYLGILLGKNFFIR